MALVQSTWNSLEITKLVIGVLTPIVIALLGYVINRSLQRIQKMQWANQKVIEKRIDVFDKAAPLLNDLYCYYKFVGNWKELSPKEVINTKRTLDKHLNVYSPLFSSNLIELYNKYTNLCFKTYSGPGQDASLRTPIVSQDGDRREVFLGDWNPEWEDLFTEPSDHFDRSKIVSAYKQLMEQFSEELGIGLERTRHR